MGIWSEHFHPKVLLRWEVLGWIITALLAVASIVLVFDQFLAANICFGLVAIFFFAKILGVASSHKESMVSSLLFAFLLCGLVGSGLTATVYVVNRYRDKHSPLPPEKSLTRAGPLSEGKPCVVVATVSTDVFSRLYFRGIRPPGKNVSFAPHSQELFYEWKLVLVPNCDINNASVMVHNVFPLERQRFIPEQPQATFSLTPKWKSGFPEKRKPDFYDGQFHFPVLQKSAPTTITLRLPLYFQLPVGSKGIDVKMPFQRDFTIAAIPSGNIELRTNDIKERNNVIGGKLLTFATKSLTGPKGYPPRIRNPEEPVPPLIGHELEAIYEFRCADNDPNCNKPIIMNPEARTGDSSEVTFNPEPKPL